MCMFKNHVFIYFLRPPSWSGTVLKMIEDKEDRLSMASRLHYAQSLYHCMHEPVVSLMIAVMSSVLLVYLFQENKSYAFILWCTKKSLRAQYLFAMVLNLHLPNGHMVYLIGLVISIHTHCDSILHKHDSLIHIPFHTYLSSLALAALQQMSPSLLSFQSRLSLFTHHMG